MRQAETWSEAILRAVADVTPTVRMFEIAPAGEAPLSAPFGGHINIGVLANGRHDTRSYSLLGTENGCYRIAVKSEPDGRGGSQYMWSLKPGARLAISNARTNFPLDFGRPDYLLIAGGIGITPIYGMALALARQGAHVRLAYAAREANELAFLGDLRSALGDRLTTHVSSQGGRADLAGLLKSVSPGGLAMVCGPLRMLDDARRIWKSLDRPMPDLRFETFGSSGAYAPEAFTVRVPQLDREIYVPENRSMLEALAEAGVDVISDCKRGECGVCAINVLAVDGAVDHRDVFFSEKQKKQNRKICACVSRVIGTVTIDPLIRPDAPRSC